MPMRSVMNDRSRVAASIVREEAVSARNQYADRLIEKWSKKKNLALEGLVDLRHTDPHKARNLAIVLENQENHLRKLPEAVISSTFAMTPQNVIKIIRLGYPNSVRGEIFTEWAMESMKDTMYKLEPIYSIAKRGATTDQVMYESSVDRYPTEIEMVTATFTVGQPTATATLSPQPVRPYTVKIIFNGRYVGTDDGAGSISGKVVTANDLTGTVNYGTGALTVTFPSNLVAGDVVQVEFHFDSEVSANYDEMGYTDLRLVPYDFRAQPYPIGFGWSKMTELIMDSILGVDAEEALVAGASDELKKALDYRPLKMAYRSSFWTPAVTFNADWAAAGSDSDYAHAQTLLGIVQQAGNRIYTALNRGGVSAIVGGPSAVMYAMKNRTFKDEGRQPEVGVFKVGTFNGKPLYQAPSSIIPDNTLLCVFKNERADANDSAVNIGTFVPLYRTMTLEFANFYKQSALAFFGDMRVTNPQYLVRVEISNIPGSP